MNNLTNWINKNLDIISKDNFFIKFFQYSILEFEEILEEYYLSNDKEGIGLVFDRNKNLTAIHLHSGFSTEYGNFTYEIPSNLNFNLNQIDISIKLGKANLHGGGYSDLLLGEYIPKWDKYYFDKYSIHIQYTKDLLNIELITIISSPVTGV